MIILLTVIVKAATLPLTKQQVSTNHSFFWQIYWRLLSYGNLFIWNIKNNP